jgi:hypothetical protein
MNCSLDEVRNLILWAILCLSIAIGLAYAWVAAFPLFAAAPDKLRGFLTLRSRSMASPPGKDRILDFSVVFFTLAPR